jgi:threonine dehydratase
VAAILAGRVRPQGPTMLLLSGANIDMGLHLRIASGEHVDLLAEAPPEGIGV